MTTPNHTISPMVKRALEAQARSGHACRPKAEPTLGDRIPADKAHTPKESK